MMVVTSLYTVIDGFFVSNYAGKMAFAAVNLIWPFLQLISAAGFMFGSGGSALTAFVLGTGDEKKANEIFTMLMAVLAVTGVVISVVGFIFMRQIAVILGADEYLIDDCVLYGRILICANPLFMMQNAYQSFLVTAERPRFGLGIAIMAGLINGILDFLLVAVFPLGVWGAGLATALSQIAGGLIPTIYFMRKNKSRLRFVKTKLDFPALWKACGNGSSEMMTNLSGAVGLGMTAAAEFLAGPISFVYVGYDPVLCEMTIRGMKLFGFSFFISGFNIFASAFFTGLNNGMVSAMISMLRTVVFQVAAVLLLPLWMELDGIWLSVVAAEAVTLVITAAFFVGNRKKYHYF